MTFIYEPDPYLLEIHRMCFAGGQKCRPCVLKWYRSVAERLGRRPTDSWSATDESFRWCSLEWSPDDDIHNSKSLFIITVFSSNRHSSFITLDPVLYYIYPALALPLVLNLLNSKPVSCGIPYQNDLEKSRILSLLKLNCPINWLTILWAKIMSIINCICATVVKCDLVIVSLVS